MDVGGRYSGTSQVIFLFSKESLNQFCCVGVTGAVTGPFRPRGGPVPEGRIPTWVFQLRAVFYPGRTENPAGWWS